jgi:centromere protein I
VDKICDHSYQYGLPEDELRRLVQLVTTRTELDQSSVITLIKSLYPAAQVKSDVIALIINCLGQVKHNPSTSTQIALVQWVIAISEVLEDHASISRSYAVLFNLLDMISIRYEYLFLLVS